MLSGLVLLNWGRPTAACSALMMSTAVCPPTISATISWASAPVAMGMGAPMLWYLSWTHCPGRLSNIRVAESNLTATRGSGTLSSLLGSIVSANTYKNCRYGTAMVLNGLLLTCW